MRLSEAILLGSVSIKWVAGSRAEWDGSGCALGMAEYSVGKFRSYPGAESVWPWLSSNNPAEMYPCGCCKNIGVSWSAAIAQTFNNHVMGDRTWTLERLCEWIDSVDPTPRIEPPVQEPSPVEVRQESTVSHD